METNPLTILCGDAIEQLRALPDESVHCCVTSPPYWGLRDYGSCDCAVKAYASDSLLSLDGSGRTAGQVSPTDARCRITPNPNCPHCRGSGKLHGVSDAQLGLEKTPEEYVVKVVEIFREVRRVLRKDGTLWMNLGDSYASSWPAPNTRRNIIDNPMSGGKRGPQRPERMGNGLKEKDLCGIPWRVAFALQADGWYLRQDIIWNKPNPMPESVTDRCTKAHEYLFLLAKSARYFFDNEAIKEAAEYGRREWSGVKGNLAGVGINGERGHATVSGGDPSAGRNKRSVWTVATAPYPEAHFATYPPDLIKPCIMAGTSAKGCCAKCGAPWERIVENRGESLSEREARLSMTAKKIGDQPNQTRLQQGIHLGTAQTKTLGWQPTCKCSSVKNSRIPITEPFRCVPCTVLDPFAGSGTTGEVAIELGRKAILIELNPKYVELIKRRCDVTIGLALA